MDKQDSNAAGLTQGTDLVIELLFGSANTAGSDRRAGDFTRFGAEQLRGRVGVWAGYSKDEALAGL